MPRPFLFRDGTTDSPLAIIDNEHKKDMNLDTLDMTQDSQRLLHDKNLMINLEIGVPFEAETFHLLS